MKDQLPLLPYCTLISLYAMWCKLFFPFLILILVSCLLPMHLMARGEGNINHADQTGLSGPPKRMIYMHRQYPEPVNRSLNKAQWQKLTSDKAFIYIDDTPPDAHQTLNTGATFWMNVLDFFRHGTGQILIWMGLAILIIQAERSYLLCQKRQTITR
jgi:hypothetical protein